MILVYLQQLPCVVYHDNFLLKMMLWISMYNSLKYNRILISCKKSIYCSLLFFFLWSIIIIMFQLFTIKYKYLEETFTLSSPKVKTVTDFYINIYYTYTTWMHIMYAMFYLALYYYYCTLDTLLFNTKGCIMFQIYIY